MLWWQTTPKGPWSVSRDPFFNFSHISGMTEVTVAKFCMQVEYIKCLASDDRLHPNECDQGHVTCFLWFCPNHIFGNGEARHFKFLCANWYIGVLVHALYITPKRDVSCDDVTSLNFGKQLIISCQQCNIETQLQWNTNRKSYVAYQMAPLPMPLKVTFAVWNLTNSHISWNIAQIY